MTRRPEKKNKELEDVEVSSTKETLHICKTSVCVCVCVCVSVCVCLSVCMYICTYLFLSVCLSNLFKPMHDDLIVMSTGLTSSSNCERVRTNR